MRWSVVTLPVLVVACSRGGGNGARAPSLEPVEVVASGPVYFYPEEIAGYPDIFATTMAGSIPNPGRYLHDGAIRNAVVEFATATYLDVLGLRPSRGRWFDATEDGAQAGVTVMSESAARMLAPTADLHLSLRAGDRAFPSGTRAVDPLFRPALLRDYVDVDSRYFNDTSQTSGRWSEARIAVCVRGRCTDSRWRSPRT